MPTLKSAVCNSILLELCILADITEVNNAARLTVDVTTASRCFFSPYFVFTHTHRRIIVFFSTRNIYISC